MTGVDLEISFDQQSLWVLGNMNSYKMGRAEAECWIMRSSLYTPNTAAIVEKISGAYFGNKDYNEKCLGLATNRNNQQIVTASAIAREPGNSGGGQICNIIMLNEYHEVRWSKEFGNGNGGSID